MTFLLQTRENNLTAHKITANNKQKKTLLAQFLCNILWTPFILSEDTPAQYLLCVSELLTIKSVIRKKKKMFLYNLLYISVIHTESVIHIRNHLQPFQFLNSCKLF